MKTLLVIILSIITTGQVFADCSSHGLWVLPSKKIIKQNSLIVLTGYLKSQKIVDSLNIKYPIYLQSTGHKVKLCVQSTYKGAFRLTQVVLEPDEKLIVGEIYQLKIDNLDERENAFLTKWNSKLGKEESLSWKVENSTDTAMPKLLQQAEFCNTNSMLYGCGPAVYAYFKIQARDESKVLVKTELVDLERKESAIYLLDFNDIDMVRVGRGMCAGAFAYKENGKYTIRFSLMDICGNESTEWTDWIAFDSPLEK